MSTVKSKKLQVGTDASAANNFTLYQPATPDGTLRIGVGNADSPTEVGQFNANGYKAADKKIFSYHADGSQTISSATTTKITFQTQEYDTTGGEFTNNQTFTPTVAGYYLITAQIQPQSAYTGGSISIFKNGSSYKIGGFSLNVTLGGQVVSAIVYANGTTDYFEIYGRFETGQIVHFGSTGFSYFQAHLISQA